MKASTAERRMAEEARVAADLLRQIGRDDDTLSHDMVEAETGLLEAIDAALSAIDEAEAISAGLAVKISEFQSRKSAAERRVERIRAAIEQAMSVAGLKSAVRAGATLSLKDVPPRPVIADEAAIPAKFWAPQAPKLDRKAITAAAKSGPIPGVEMSNGGVSLQIRRT